MFEAWFRYVPGGPLYPYRLDYATAAEAGAAETWLAVNGFWFQRPDDATVFETAQTVTVPVPSLLLGDGVSHLVQGDGVSKILVTT